MKETPRKGAIMDGLARNTKPPCQGCESRSVGCHSKCEKYIEYRTKLDEKKAVVSKQLSEEYDVQGYSIQATRKRKRRLGVK